MPYNELVPLTPSATPANYVFRGNSIFDPNFTGTGHQPMFHDPYSNIYDRYYVTSSTIRVEITTDEAEPIIAVLYPSNASSPIGVIDQAVEQPRSVFHTKSRNGDKCVLKNSCSSKAIRGVDILRDDGQSALFSSNPANQWFWHITLQNMDLLTTTTVYINVRILYNCVLYRKLQGVLS